MANIITNNDKYVKYIYNDYYKYWNNCWLERATEITVVIILYNKSHPVIYINIIFIIKSDDYHDIKIK
jgi:hypothetical protein